MLSQFAGGSLWFAGNAVLTDLQAQWGLAPEALAYIISSVQLGFIAGTLSFAFLSVSDRISPRLVFFACSLLGALALIFRVRLFRASSFGYFGHMWELYAFWAFVPVVLAAHAGGGALDVPTWSFAIIAAGAAGCVAGGRISLRYGSARVAFVQLAASGLCCALSPLLFYASPALFLAFLIFWGIVVVGDSPQFSALNAAHAPRALVGSALTIANCLGFAITIASIQLLSYVSITFDPAWLFVLLVPGPVLGLIALKPLLRPAAATGAA